MVQEVSEHIKSTDVELGTLETKEETSAKPPLGCRGDIDGPRDSRSHGAWLGQNSWLFHDKRTPILSPEFQVLTLKYLLTPANDFQARFSPREFDQQVQKYHESLLKCSEERTELISCLT